MSCQRWDPTVSISEGERALWFLSESLQRPGSHRGHLSYFTQHKTFWLSDIYSSASQRHGGLSDQPSELGLKCENQSVGWRHAVQTLGVRTEDAEVGGHCVGVWLVPMFTTGIITLLGINHSVSLAPTTVTQTIETTFQLIYCRLTSVCQCMYTLFMQMSASGCVCVYTTEVHYVLILMLLTLLLFCRIPAQPQITCITPLSFVCWHFLQNVLCRCPRSFCLRSLCCGLFPAQMLVVSLPLRPCWALVHRGLRLLECLGNISAPESRDHLVSTWYGHISLQLITYAWCKALHNTAQVSLLVSDQHVDCTLLS